VPTKRARHRQSDCRHGRLASGRAPLRLFRCFCGLLRPRHRRAAIGKKERAHWPDQAERTANCVGCFIWWRRLSSRPSIRSSRRTIKENATKVWPRPPHYALSPESSRACAGRFTLTTHNMSLNAFIRSTQNLPLKGLMQTTESTDPLVPRFTSGFRRRVRSCVGPFARGSNAGDNFIGVLMSCKTEAKQMLASR